MEYKNSNIQGNAGLGAAISYLTRVGHVVLIPLTDSQDYDLVVEINSKLDRVQVKTTNSTSKYGYYKVCLKTSGGNKSGTGKTKYFDNSKVEWVFVLAGNNSQYFIPSKEIEAKAQINLGDKWKAYKI